MIQPPIFVLRRHPGWWLQLAAMAHSVDSNRHIDIVISELQSRRQAISVGISSFLKKYVNCACCINCGRPLFVINILQALKVLI